MLSDTEIRHARARGHLSIQHADEDAIQPASFDFYLGTQFAVPIGMPHEHQVDAQLDFPGFAPLIEPYRMEDPSAFWRRFSCDRYVLHPSQFLLAVTREEIKLDHSLYARVEGKSTLGRWGLLVHTTAGFIDPGFHGPITLELRNVGPFRIQLYKDMRICQIAFGRVEGVVAHPYSGHYQNQKGVGLPY